MIMPVIDLTEEEERALSASPMRTIDGDRLRMRLVSGECGSRAIDAVVTGAALSRAV